MMTVKIGGLLFKAERLELKYAGLGDYGTTTHTLVIERGLYGFAICTSRGGGMGRGETYRWQRSGVWTREPIGSEREGCFDEQELPEAVERAIAATANAVLR